MEKKQMSLKKKRWRRFLWAAPALVCPFVTVIFWAMGGGKTDKNAADPQTAAKGVNKTLPAPHLKSDRPTDKLAYYEEARVDSIRLADRRKDSAPLPEFGVSDSGSKFKTLPAGYHDPNEQKVYAKLDELKAALHAPSVAVTPPPQPQASIAYREAIPAAGLARLEKMLQGMKAGEEDGSDMQQLNGVLDKLIAVQHPGQTRDSIREHAASQQAAPLPVREGYAGPAIYSLPEGRDRGPGGRDSSLSPGGFYGLTQSVETAPLANAISALIPRSQTLVNGSTIRLQLLTEIHAGGSTIPAGTDIYGTAALNNERLMVNIRSLRQGAQLLTVNLQVYDEDGLEGIYMPGAISRDMAKQSADQGINSFGMGSLDPSLGAQAGTTGIQLAKNLLARKVKTIRVTVNAGYRVWLKDASKH